MMTFAQWHAAALRPGNSPVPGWAHHVETAKMIYAAECERQAKQEAERLEVLGINRLQQRNAALEKRVAHLERVINATVKRLGQGVEVSNENWRKQEQADGQLHERIKVLEARPVDAVDLDFDLIDGRTLQVKNGAAVKSFALPVPVDAGIYQSGKAYTAGQCVTHRGSYWICKEFTSATPGKSNYWRLVAKRGTDGKDAGR